MKKLKFPKSVYNLSMILTAIGGLNWGLVALDFNLVEYLANLVNLAVLQPVVYGLVGISALLLVLKSLKVIK